ncbi:restriction endonuclease S subunit [Acetobacter estunensis NRIC 0472]|nr:restriction endonuclease S subunit [Acetobacter estunensis NRIC 0472]
MADCHEFKIPLAPLSEQISIGKILAALDDKIDLNRRTNETLEAMARALFRDWFVDFGPTRAKMAGQTPYLAPEIWELFPDRLDDEGKPEGWGVTTLGNLAETCGENISPEAVGPETPYVGLEHLPRHSLALTDWGTADKVTSGKSRFLRGNILFGKLRPYFHKVVIAPVSGICSTDIVVIDSKKTFFRSIVRLLCSSEDFVEFTDRTSQGTKMPRTSWTAMRSYELTRIPDDVASIFEDFASPNFFKIERNIRESRSLVQLRDLLLPKLMSGEIRIRDAEKMLADAL